MRRGGSRIGSYDPFMADAACETLINRLVADVPALQPVYNEHVANNDELLTYVFLADVARFVMAALTGAKPEHRSDAVRVLGLLEDAIGSDDPDVVNLVAVGFVESLLGEEALPFVRPTLGQRLAAELVAQETWKP
jgi:hypothetical protein